MRPTARRDAGLIVRAVGDETIVYDRESHQAHCLNATAALVFGLCDGSRTPQEIAAVLPGAEAAARVALVEATLDTLQQTRLLEPDDPGSTERSAAVAPTAGSSPPAESSAVEAATTTAPPASPSRRQLLQHAGAALLLPAIVTILAPTPAQAGSGCIDGGQCTNPANCGKPCYAFPYTNCTGPIPTYCNNAGACTDVVTTCP